MSYVIGVDIGSTNIKACAFDERAGLLARHSAACAFIPGTDALHREQDPDAMRRAVAESVAAVQADMGGRPAAVAFSSAMHSLIAVDEHGRPLTRCLSWADLRSGPVARALRETDTGRALYRQCGTPIHPMSPLLKITWLQQNEPEIAARTYKYVGIKEYVLYDWLGRWVVDYSTASATGLFDIHSYEWNAFALSFAGIGAGHLAEPVDGPTMLTGLKPARARELNLPEDTPVVVGASDGCLANLGALVFNPRSAVITLGTSAAIRGIREAPTPDPGGRLFNYVLYRGRYVVGGPSNNGGYLLQWFHRCFEEGQELEARVAAAEAVAAGADGLMCIPHILGERAPLWDPDATGAFLGMRAHHGAGHFYRAMLEAMVMNIRAIGLYLESVTGGLDALHVNGGLSGSDLVMQILADVFDVPARRTPTEEASARGAAILALMALRVIDRPEALDAGAGEQPVFEPDPDRARRYAELFSRYEETVAAYQPIGARLSEL